MLSYSTQSFMKKYEFKIVPTIYNKYYKILYRVKKKYNWFNYYKELTREWDNGPQSSCEIIRSHPVMFEDFEEARSKAEYFKNNPGALEKFMQEEDVKYLNAQIGRHKFLQARNKSAHIS